MKIMFICTENTCRSAMAEAMLKNILKQKENAQEYSKKNEQSNKNIEVYSCGIFAESGDVPTQDAIEVMAQYGINLKNHRATNIKEAKLEQMDLILCATISHKASVLQMYPELSGKVFTIKEYAGFAKEGTNYDISDPWGYSKKVYEDCAKEIEICLQEIVKKL